jgi:glycosyltransferase involved in cell wall biosynthesis
MSMVVAAFPSIEQLVENPYWSILRSALGDVGVGFTSDVSQFGRRWLWANRSSIDVLHFHYVQQFYAYESTGARLRWVVRFARNLLLARAWGYRTVFTLHNLSPTYPLRPRWVDYWGHWVAANLTDSVIVHCNFARWALAERFRRRKNVYLVPHPHFIGIYPNEVSREEARNRLGLSKEQTGFAFFGGIRPNKGIEALLDAFSRLPGRNLRLLVVGKPWFPPEYVVELKESAQKDDRIRIIAEFVPADQVQIYLNASDVVVLPFASILTSSSTVLALSFGRPVVVPAMGCLPELVTEGVGWLYDPEDPDSLVHTLQECTEVDLQSMGRRALDRVREFSWQEMADQTLAAYRVPGAL